MELTTQYTLATAKRPLRIGHSFLVFGFHMLETGRENGRTIQYTFLEVLKRDFLHMNDETFLNEIIQVVAVFKGGHHPCMPVRFKRVNGREVQVTELGLRHPLPHGSKTIHAFDVTDGGTDYRLEFDSERLIWRLTMEADHYE